MKLGLLWFDLSHRYLYTLLIFSLCNIRNSERNSGIVCYSTIPGQQVIDISCKYYYYGWIHITDFSCYLLFGFHVYFFTAQKHRTTFSSHYSTYQAWVLKHRSIQGSILLLWLRLVYCYKSTGTPVTKCFSTHAWYVE